MATLPPSGFAPGYPGYFTGGALPAPGTRGLNLSGFGAEALSVLEIIAPAVAALISLFAGGARGQAGTAPPPRGNRAPLGSTCAAAQRNAQAVCAAMPSSAQCASAQGYAAGVCRQRTNPCAAGFYLGPTGTCIPIGSVGVQ